METGKERLYSLDLLRGADIFFLTVLSGLIMKVNGVWKLPAWLTGQISHPAWVGFTAYDMIMPLFIFMCGAALPLALPKRLNPDGTAGKAYWLHVLKRVGMLWFFGLVVQGCLLSFDLHVISFFNNTLQTIACGYIFAALVQLIRVRWIQIAIPFALAALYTLFLHTCGDMTPEGNAAVVYEVKFLSLFYPSPEWHPVKQIASWHYTWWTTVPMFGVMGLAGWHATTVLIGAAAKRTKLLTLVGVGVGLLALGFALSTFDPIVKHIFTASFTSLAMGTAFLLYALFYGLFDMLGWRRGTGLLNLFGRHSLFAYLFGTFFGAATRSLLAVVLCNHDKYPNGLSRFFGSAPVFDLVFTVCYCAALCGALYVWDCHRRPRA